MPADDNDVIGIPLEVAAAIEAAGGEYFVGGSVASSMQGEPRATNDIDIVLTLPLGRIAAFAESRDVVEVLRVSGREMDRDISPPGLLA